MGLDVYVGSLTRYYSGDWQNAAQKWGQEQGVPVTIVRPHEVPPPPPADEVLPAVLAWRRRISKELAANLDAPLDWIERADTPYFTDRPGFDAFGGLILWAAHEEHPEIEPRKTIPSIWSKDAAFLASQASGFRSRYRNLVHEVELWLPCDFRFTFVAEDVAGNKTPIGSSVSLLEELRDLNDRTWKAQEALLSEWRRDCPERRLRLEDHARFGFAVLLELTRLSVERRLPMKLDC